MSTLDYIVQTIMVPAPAGLTLVGVASLVDGPLGLLAGFVAALAVGIACIIAAVFVADAISATAGEKP